MGEKHVNPPFVIARRVESSQIDDLLRAFFDASPDELDEAIKAIEAVMGSSLPPKERKIEADPRLLKTGFDQVTASLYSPECVEEHLEKTPITIIEGWAQFAQRRQAAVYNEDPRLVPLSHVLEALLLMAPLAATVEVLKKIGNKA